MLLLNLFITLVCFWIMFRINSLFIQPAKWNKHRFKLFELRDNLAILAMKGDIKEESEEYITLMSMLNEAVNQTKKFQTVDFLRFLYHLKKNNEVQEIVKDILRRCNSENKEFISIFHGYFEVVHEMFKVQSRAIYWVVPPVIALLGFCKILASFALVLTNKLELLNKLRDDIKEKKELTLNHVHI